MKNKRSARLLRKAGYTLVELVVTVAILGIVSTMGVGIVAKSINNYSDASVTSVEQDTAVKIEQFILKSARTAVSVEFRNTFTDDIVPTKKKNENYLATVGNQVKEITSTVEGSSVNASVSKLSYNGVKKITVKLRKQKSNTTETQKDCHVCLDYVIEMKEKFTLKGSVIMNNVSPDYNISANNSFKEEGTTWEIADSIGDAAIVFVK